MDIPRQIFQGRCSEADIPKQIFHIGYSKADIPKQIFQGTCSKAGVPSHPCPRAGRVSMAVFQDIIFWFYFLSALKMKISQHPHEQVELFSPRKAFPNPRIVQPVGC